MLRSTVTPPGSLIMMDYLCWGCSLLVVHAVLPDHCTIAAPLKGDAFIGALSF